MTATPDTETRVIVDLMLALNKILNRCDLASEAGGHTISIAVVRTIALSALHRAQDNAQPTPADPVSPSELSRLVACEMSRRSAARGTS